nr:MAG TPA: hypothetical protein [Bacteriophage sp.]
MDGEPRSRNHHRPGRPGRPGRNFNQPGHAPSRQEDTRPAGTKPRIVRKRPAQQNRKIAGRTRYATGPSKLSANPDHAPRRQYRRSCTRYPS